MKNVHKGYGAILGDMVGVPYEMKPIYTKDFNFFNKDNHWSDDTIMTIATMSKYLNNSNFTLEYKWWGNKYYGDYYGKMFKEWLKREDWTSNESYGNGAAMRVSPIGYANKDRDKMVTDAISSAMSSHGMDGQARKGATIMAYNIFMINNLKLSKRQMANDLNTKDLFYSYYSPEPLEKFTKFKVSCDYTVPIAMKCFTQCDDISDIIRTAVSLGGDCDTIASMAAELQVAYEGQISPSLADYVEQNIPADMLYVLKEFNKKY